MKFYDSCPRPKAARDVWKHFSRKHAKAPLRLWHRPNCFRSNFSVEGGAWGCWIADYGTFKDYYDPTGNEKSYQVRNMFSFLRIQAELDKC